MKKVFKLAILSSILFFPALASAQGIVKCDGTTANPCTLTKLVEMFAEIYKFVAIQIATPLAIIMLIVAAIVLLSSAGDPGRQTLGKKILWTAIIGLVLALGSWLIVTTVLTTIGATVT